MTMTCLSGKRVVDVVVGESHPGSLGSDAHILERCPRCRSKQVIPWGKSRPYPKCGGTMKKLATGRVCFGD